MQKIATSSYSLSEEIVKLDQLRQEGILSQAEFERGKENLLQGVRVNQEMQNRLAQVEVQNRLTELDRKWEDEKKQYMVQGRYGTHEPQKSSWFSVITIVVAFMTLLVYSVNLGSSKTHSIGYGIVWFGFISSIIAILVFLKDNKKAEKYQNAKLYYEKKRSNIEIYKKN
jgi:hypothetical protein